MNLVFWIILVITLGLAGFVALARLTGKQYTKAEREYRLKDVRQEKRK